ncbi:hypothetical protein NOC27_3071 [Nitrosococcus oceani AFC27]|nr:hypothetical protein NOC27_3071 [Nitrosococcus oceani AFC27]
MGFHRRNVHIGAMLTGLPEIIGVLQPEPVCCIRLAECHFKPQRHLRRNYTTTVEYLGKGLSAYAQMTGSLSDR